MLQNVRRSWSWGARCWGTRQACACEWTCVTVSVHSQFWLHHAQIVERGCALLGYAPVGNVGLLLLATRLRTAATLPGSHTVRLVTESRWMLLPLEVGAQPSCGLLSWHAPQLLHQTCSPGREAGPRVGRMDCMAVWTAFLVGLPCRRAWRARRCAPQSISGSSAPCSFH